MLKHLYNYQDYKALIISSGGEIPSQLEYVIMGLEDLMQERIDANDEAFILEEHLVHTQVVPDLRGRFSNKSSTNTSRTSTTVTPISAKARNTFNSLKSRSTNSSTSTDKFNPAGYGGHFGKNIARSTGLDREVSIDGEDELTKMTREGERKKAFLRRKAKLIRDIWNIDSEDEGATKVEGEPRGKSAHAKARARKDSILGPSAVASLKPLREKIKQSNISERIIMAEEEAKLKEAMRPTIFKNPDTSQLSPTSPGSPPAPGYPKSGAALQQAPGSPPTAGGGAQQSAPGSPIVMMADQNLFDESSIAAANTVSTKSSLWSDLSYFDSEEFKERPTRFRRYLREVYVEQARKGADIMELFFLKRLIPQHNIFKYDFSEVNDHHPQDVLDNFLQMPGKKIIYYTGHTTLDGGWWFSWRNSIGLPDSWIIRPEDCEFGPPDRCGTPLMIVDGSHSLCWLEPSPKFITVACYEGPADGGGKRGPALARCLSGIDCDTKLLEELTPAQIRKVKAQQRGVRSPAAQYWDSFNKDPEYARGNPFYEVNSFIEAPKGAKLRCKLNYEDSIVIRLPLYIMLYNKPTVDAVWSLRATMETASFDELSKARVGGVLKLVLMVIAGQEEFISASDISAFSNIAGNSPGAIKDEEKEDTNPENSSKELQDNSTKSPKSAKNAGAGGSPNSVGKHHSAPKRTVRSPTQLSQQKSRDLQHSSTQSLFQQSGTIESPGLSTISQVKYSEMDSLLEDSLPPVDPKTARMREEAVRVLGLLARVLRLDEIEEQSLPVVTEYVSNTNNFPGWLALAKLGQAYRDNSNGTYMHIRTQISRSTWERDLHLPEYYNAKTEAIAKCGAGLVAVPREQLLKDCEQSLGALIQLGGDLPKWCRMENLHDAREGCRLLAEGKVLNPKLAFRTLQKYPYDPETLRWGLLALSRGGFHLLDQQTAYIPVINALTLKNLGIPETMKSASICLKAFLSNGLWDFCNIWETCQILLDCIHEKCYAAECMEGLLACCATLQSRGRPDGLDGLPHFELRWRPLTAEILHPTRVMPQKTLDNAFSCLSFVIQYQSCTFHATNDHSVAIDLVNHWNELLLKVKVVELIPGLKYLTRQMKTCFYQKAELEKIAKELAAAEEALKAKQAAEGGKAEKRKKKRAKQTAATETAK